jgi:hypothetical protein
MWKSGVELIDEGRVRRITLMRGDTRLSYAEVIDGWENSHDFRDFFISLLADAPFQAMFWETPPVTRSSIRQPYEFVLVDSPHLAAAEPESSHFASAFGAAATGESMVMFENLGRDALLIVPCPHAPQHVYTHLATFARGAAEAQRHELFRKLATAIKRRLSDQPVWVSTSGLGVYWLHIRLDSRPKYYNFQPYAKGV